MGEPNVLQATLPTGEWWMITAIAMEIANLLVGAHSDEPGPLQGRRRVRVDGRASASNAYVVNVAMSAPIAEGLTEREKADIPHDIRLGQLLINDLRTETHIRAVPAASEYRPYWALLLQRVQSVAITAQLVRRKLLGETFREILNDYYARKERGERVKLKALAEERGVNYDSLRQAKFRYDEQRRKM